MTANDNQPNPYRNEQQRIAALEAVAERLVKSEQKYRMVIEHINEAIIIIQNGFICFANPMAIAVTGYSFEALSRINVAQLFHPEDLQEILGICNKTIREETLPLTYSFRLLHNKGTIFWMQANSVRIEWEGNPATLTLLRDIFRTKKTGDATASSQKNGRHWKLGWWYSA